MNYNQESTERSYTLLEIINCLSH